MKNFLQLFTAGLGLASIIFLTSCSAHNKMSSLSRPHYKKAELQKKQGKKLASIYSASQGVIADVKYTSSKEFLYENYEQVMKETNAELKKYKTTKDTADAVRQLYIYNTLVKINSNIAKMEMPLKHHKNKWEWKTETKDFRPNVEESVSFAYTTFFNFAKLTLNESKEGNDVANANSVFIKGHNRYTAKGSERRQTSLQNITVELCNFADLHKDANSWEEAILAGYAFHYAKSYLKDSIRVYQGYDYSAKRISTLLTEDGIMLTKKNDTESLLKANSRYENAIGWNKDNNEAINLKEALKEKIAESYYQTAKTKDKQLNADLIELKKLYENAMIWMPNYKDCQARIYSVSIRHELIALQANIETTQKEFTKTRENVKKMSTGVDKSKKAMDKVIYVSENIIDLNKKGKNITKAISPLCGLPIIGIPLGVTKKSINILQVPVGKTATFFKSVDKPVVRPMNTAVTKIKTMIDLLKEKMKLTNNVLENTKKTAASLETCIHKVKDEKALKESEIAIKELSKNILKINNELKNLNGSVNSVTNTTNEVTKIVSFTNPVEKGIKEAKPVIKEINKGAKEINKVLDKKVAKAFGTTYKVRDALALTGPLKWVMDKALGFLDPVMKQFSSSIPQIPGTDALMLEVDKLKGKYDAVNEEANSMKKKYDAYSFIQKEMEKNLNILVENTGCGMGVSSFSPEGIYRIKASKGNKYWDLAGNEVQSNKNGTNLQLWSKDNGKDQTVKFVAVDEQYFVVEFQNGSRVLDVSGNKPDCGRNLQTWTKNNGDGQKFEFIPVPNKKDTYYILSKLSGRAIDANKGETSKNGTNLQIWDLNKSSAQQWKIIKVK